MSITAMITPDFNHVHLQGQHWSETFPITRLAEKIAFYASLRDRKGGAYAQHYEPTIKELERVQKIYTKLQQRKDSHA